MPLRERIHASLARRGLFGTVVLGFKRIPDAVSALVDHLTDRRLGVRTGGVTELDQLAIDSPNRERGVRYEPTRAAPFVALMKRQQLPTDGRFADIGCGRGRVLVLAATLGFHKLEGVDFASEVCRDAEENLAAFAHRTGLTLDWRITCGDATQWTPADDVTVFYMFNPFDATVLDNVLARIKESLDRRPRNAWIVYYNPIWHETVDRHGRFARVTDSTIRGCRFIVWKATGEKVFTNADRCSR